MEIVNFFYELARQHRQIRSFYYGRAYNKGAANEMHPLVWLDDPIGGRSVNQTLVYTCNVDILGLPKDDSETLDVQSEAFAVGLDFAERIKQSRAVTGYSLDGFAFLSLSDYYDNAAAGYRFTYTLIHANAVGRCIDNFDLEKQLAVPQKIPAFKAGCEAFLGKQGLPNFKIGEQ